MALLYWAFLQLLAYPILQWLGFIAIAFIAAWFLGKPGIFMGHLLIAIAVTALDVQWIQSEIHKPGWNGQPDQDIGFMIGVVLRIILINTVLLPISFLALRIRRRAKRNSRQA